MNSICVGSIVSAPKRLSRVSSARFVAVGGSFDSQVMSYSTVRTGFKNRKKNRGFHRSTLARFRTGTCDQAKHIVLVRVFASFSPAITRPLPLQLLSKLVFLFLSWFTLLGPKQVFQAWENPIIYIPLLNWVRLFIKRCG